MHRLRLTVFPLQTGSVQGIYLKSRTSGEQTTGGDGAACHPGGCGI